MTVGRSALRGEAVRRDDPVALGRAISLVENGRTGFEALLQELQPRVGQAHRVGITGPPGAGKSTLSRGLVGAWRAQALSVGVVAVDPSSPRTGGALLGDRIRMDDLTLDQGVFIRSMASRGALGGLALTTREVADVLDAAGFDRVLVETVGVGQSELDIVEATDTTVVVLVPESGDGVQTLKSGLMEIADLYVVNKADREGADHLVREIEISLSLRSPAPEAGWRPRVLPTVATAGTGIEPLREAIEAHRAWLLTSGQLRTRRDAQREALTRDLLERVARDWIRTGTGIGVPATLVASVRRGTTTPYAAAEALRQGLARLRVE